MVVLTSMDWELKYTSENKIPGIILNIDFEKAFDSLNWDFVQNFLTSFNFGPKFKGCIATLYNSDAHTHTGIWCSIESSVM